MHRTHGSQLKLPHGNRTGCSEHTLLIFFFSDKAIGGLDEPILDDTLKAPC